MKPHKADAGCRKLKQGVYRADCSSDFTRKIVTDFASQKLCLTWLKSLNAEMHLFDCVGRDLALSTEHPILLPDVWFGHIITKAAGHEGNEIRLY